ncbi:MAG TPA: aconitase X, partial [Vicinamibacterales bacterium]
GEPETIIEVRPEDIADTLARLSTAPNGTPLTAVCLGTPHFSIAEWERLLAALPDPGTQPPRVPIYVNTDRKTLARIEADTRFDTIRRNGLVVVTDTCTYLTPILERLDGVVMTNSGKWAHYAPGNLGVNVAFGELEECVASAFAGQVVRVTR